VSERLRYSKLGVGSEARIRTYNTADLIEECRRLYREKGISYTLWWFIAEVYKRRKHPIKFEDLYRLHQLVANVRSKNSTAKALRRLENYGLIENLGGGLYKPLVLDESIVEGSIDFSRTRTRDQVLGGEAKAGAVMREEMPRELEPILRRARELIERGEKWRAVDLLSHTLLPVRMSGILFAKKGALFIYYERKTDKMHILKSWRVAQIFEALGIKDEVLARHRFHEADDIIKRLFGSHDNARRIHYLLKEKGWFEYPEENYYYRMFKSEIDDAWWVSIYKLNKSGQLEEEFKVKVGGDATFGVQVKAGAVLTREHVKDENEETYFHRSKGWI